MGRQPEDVFLGVFGAASDVSANSAGFKNTKTSWFKQSNMVLGRPWEKAIRDHLYEEFTRLAGD